ncbi:Crp/Fnr family transcriptional regulator [Ruegeria faecimaris]|uniref:Cyclic nucleotide-binding domain-containing protein n=1 Tax=Ruegeria faecimaris TaxID=686389 RepID=A0A521F9L2_9RHOB|nr:cyclic nucleotide-binding domain-containing protein [Ruegeria faecimaris]SMO92905.1 Cyclic nucleotide-binding domain-containing protein [Ruegeria faecimaris]
MLSFPYEFPELVQVATMIGVFGAGLYITGYFLLQMGIIRGNGSLYPLLVIAAAGCVLFSMSEEFNLAGSIIQLAYISISILGLLRGFLSRHLLRFSDDERQFIALHLESLKPHQARKLLNTAAVKTYENGDILIEEGKTTDFLGFVLKGRTTILKNGRVINQCGEDEILGELTFGLGLPATATVIATEPTKCLVFDNISLMRLLRRSRHIDDALKAAHFRHTRQKLLNSNKHTLQAQRRPAAA